MTRDEWIQLCGSIDADGDTVTISGDLWDEISDRNRNRTPPPICCHSDGTITADGREIENLTRTWRLMLHLLETGKCERGYMMEEIFGGKLRTMKDPRSAIYAHVCRLNALLIAHGLYIETTSDFHHLKRY